MLNFVCSLIKNDVLIYFTQTIIVLQVIIVNITMYLFSANRKQKIKLLFYSIMKSIKNILQIISLKFYQKKPCRMNISYIKS